jgi:flagellar hook-length control protein FliK
MEVKEALEASIPKLREMLNSQQVNLVNVNISQNPGSNHGRQASQPFHSANGSQTPNYEAGANPLEHIEADQIISKGLLSLYA